MVRMNVPFMNRRTKREDADKSRQRGHANRHHRLRRWRRNRFVIRVLIGIVRIVQKYHAHGSDCSPLPFVGGAPGKDKVVRLPQH